MKFTPFTYLDVSLKESVYINNVPYFTRKAIGEWLGYDRPQEAIDKIIRRNPHIDNPEWSTTVKLTVVQASWKSVPPKLRDTEGHDHTPQTGVYDREIETRVYDPIGLQLIVFESRQPKAIQYKIAVAKLVADMASGRFFLNSTLDLINSIQPYKSKYSKPDDKPIKRFALFPESEGSAKLEKSSNFSKRLKT
ncbi:BRO-N domain-containing protein [Desulforegula conservatrix]|uniref:hypothetical protein n=1 Tax=Desulforegula conservatrix TaxID=153026 RepID=UPI000423FD8B|nr:hypothetical protein [Desulforegula conservatrix]